MQTLPCELYLHSKKEFSKPVVSLSSLQEIEFINLPPFPSTIIKKSLMIKPRTTNCLNIFFEKKKKRKLSLFIILNLVLPNLFGFVLLFLVTFFENEMEFHCLEENLISRLYFSVRYIFCNCFFYILMTYHCLFYFLNDIGIATYKKVFLFSLGLLIAWIAKFLKLNDIYLAQNDSDLYTALLIFGIVLYFIIRKSLQIDKRKHLKNLFIYLGMVSSFFIHRYLFKFYLIYNFYMSISDLELNYKKVVFQIFLFCYYQTYGYILLLIIAKIYEDEKVKKIENPNRFLIVIKFYVANAICSCIALPLIQMQSEVSILFGIGNFIFQIITLYKKKNFILDFMIKILNYFFRKKLPFKLITHDSALNENLKSIIAGSTNEMVIAFTLYLLNITIFKRTLLFEDIDFGNNALNKCKLRLVDKFELKIEMVLLLFGINFFVFVFLVFEMKDEGKVEMRWKMESYNWMFRGVLIVMFCFVIDVNFQFFLFLQVKK